MSAVHDAIRLCGVPGGTTHVTGGDLPSAFGVDWPALFVSAGVLVVFALALALAVLMANRVAARPVPVRTPAGAPISPDGYYWWDGAVWRPRI